MAGEDRYTDLMRGEFNSPVQVVAFSTAEGWALPESFELRRPSRWKATFAVKSRLEVRRRDLRASHRSFSASHRSPCTKMAIRQSSRHDQGSRARFG